MLDPELVAEFEAWKQKKILGQTDLSVRAFNSEMEVQALAYEHALKMVEKEMPLAAEMLATLKASNPYRGAGMRGEQDHRRVTS